MNILHIDSSISGEYSISRQLTAEVVRALTSRHNDAIVTYRDVVEKPIGHLTGNIAAGFRPLRTETLLTPEVTAEHAWSARLVNEFLDSDIVVIGAPMYNFSVSSQLKTWLDRLAQPGKTFSYTPDGPEGHAAGKKIIVVSSRGGIYFGTPIAEMDFQEKYLQRFFGFLGIEQVEFVRAEGTTRSAEIREKGVAQALASIPVVIAALLDH